MRPVRVKEEKKTGRLRQPAQLRVDKRQRNLAVVPRIEFRIEPTSKPTTEIKVPAFRPPDPLRGIARGFEVLAQRLDLGVEKSLVVGPGFGDAVSGRHRSREHREMAGK